MKHMIYYLRLCLFLGLLTILNGCTKDEFFPVQSDYLKKTKQGEYITSQYTYNEDKLIFEVNSTSFYRKFYYDSGNKLIKEEVAVSPDMYSSSMPTSMTHEFVDPTKTGISMYSIYEYSENGNLSRQLNYRPLNGQDELRSIRSFEYDSNNRISKVLLQDHNSVVTQFSTFNYDNKGNVIEENSYSYLFIPAGTGPTHLSKVTFEYDKFINPYSIFKFTGRPGIYSNPNNIIKTKTYNYALTPGTLNFSESTISYEYNHKTGYPVKVVDGEEFIYD